MPRIQSLGATVSAFGTSCNVPVIYEGHCRSWIRCFTTAEHPTGIYVHPSKDYILLRDRQCNLAMECDGCQNDGAFDRYGGVDLIRNIITWDAAAMSSYEGSAEYDDFYHLSIKFPTLSKILVCTYCEDWFHHFGRRPDEEDIITKFLGDAREDHPMEMEDVKPPQLFAIRDCVLKYMNWTEGGGGFEPYDSNMDTRSNMDIRDFDEVASFEAWESAVVNKLSELSDEEVGACLQDFCRMTDDLQIHHLKEFLRMGKEEYLRFFYKVLGPCKPR